MNIYIYAKGFSKNNSGNKVKAEKHFNVIQTPTSETYTIVRESDKVSAYKKFVKEELGKDAQEHLERFDKFLSEVNKEGFQLCFEII